MSQNSKDFIKSLLYNKPKELFCRVCLQPVQEIHAEDIFTRICNADMEFSVTEVIENIFGMQLPLVACDKVCHTCLKLASSTYTFFKVAQESCRVLNTYVTELLSQSFTINISDKQAVLLVPDLLQSKEDLNNLLKPISENTLNKELHTNNVILKLENNLNKGGEKLDKGVTKKRRRWKRKPMTSIVCMQCPVKYRFLGKLKEHMRMEHGVDIHICKVCKACIVDEQEFQNHLRTHTNKHICEICTMVFKSRDGIINHLKWHDDIKNLINSGQGNICETCGLVFEDEISLAEHNDSSHVKKYTCFYCGKMYKGELGFESHIKKHELHMAKNGAPDKLKEIKPKESKRRKFTCCQCGKSFKHERTLMFHERLHTNDRPYTCEVCGRSFVTVNRRNQHSLCAHTAPTRRCPLCPALFHLRSMVNTHIKKVHLKAHKRRQRSPKIQNVYWRTKTVPIQELSVAIQDDVFNLDYKKKTDFFVGS
ncbi:unnamed protein product [Leptosia nina]|uniref:Uncharacterized protein n=1 Tax=Leptosia nina TaxID=320188 RepID=A0AAV1JJ11_9NEOP